MREDEHESVQALTIRRPDDWHLHLRDGAALAAVGHSARHFGRAIVMPNLRPPVLTTADALAYRRRILAALPPGSSFEPLMTLYLTENTTAAELRAARASGVVIAVKLYPAGATTNSAAGVRELMGPAILRVLGAMEGMGMPLLIHGEVTDPAVDIFDREAAFIDRVLAPLVARFPGLKVVLEHVTTADGVDFVLAQGSGRVAATITAHHLLLNRNALLVGGVHPHYYCLPVLKRERHRQALVAAATSGDPRFFLGTDSAPHARGAARRTPADAPAAPTAHAGSSLRRGLRRRGGARQARRVRELPHGPDFYGLRRNAETITSREEGMVQCARDLSLRGSRRSSPRAGGRSAGAAGGERRLRGAELLGEGDPLLLVARDDREAALSPVFLRLLDPLARARDEVPLHVATTDRLACDDHDVGAVGAADVDLLPPVEDEHLAGAGAASSPLAAANRAADHVDRALGEIVREMKERLLRQAGLGVEERRVDVDGGLDAVGFAGEHPNPDRADASLLEAIRGVVAKGGLGLLFVGRQGDPQLDAVEPAAGPAKLRAAALGVDDPATGGHPVDGAGLDRLWMPRLSRWLSCPSKR